MVNVTKFVSILWKSCGYFVPKESWISDRGGDMANGLKADSLKMLFN